MAKRGRKKLPTAVLRLHGSRRVNDRLPEPTTKGLLQPPDWLKRKKKLLQRFNALSADLHSMNICGRIDSEALARYVELADLYRKTINYVHRYGRTYTTINKRGFKSISVRPETTLALQIAKILRGLESAFGLTPQDRTSIRTTGQMDSKDELTKILERQRKLNASAG